MTTSAQAPLSGTPVVPGVAAGPVLHVRGEVSPAAIARFGDGEFADHEAALAAYDEAAAAVADTFSSTAAAAEGAAAEVLSASAGLARDKGLRTGVSKNLQTGQGPVAAVQGAVEQFVSIFTNMGGLMAERATDLRDIERRVIAHLVGEPPPGVPTPTEPSVLVAEDLAPSDTSGLDPELVTALVTERGGATSHTAIIARQLGIPCVVGAAGVMDIPAGTFVVVDGETGTIELGADTDDAARRVAESRERRAALASWTGPAATADGLPIKLLANVADGPSSASAASEPVQGV
ncbi:MAG TPA: PEP-utilizing enzyme, partial [Ornithinibacter sp.]|nr:PEP-utilizing enzyme [Ornithinibacter sp.]